MIVFVINAYTERSNKYDERYTMYPAKWWEDITDEELDKLYDDILNDLTSTNNIEFIEHLYNLDFEKIGYKRYMAPEKMSDEDRPSGIL